MLSNNASLKTAAAESAETSIEITRLARLAGIPYEITLSAALADRYGLSARRPIVDRLELYDLVWSVSSSLNGPLPAHREQTATGSRCRVEFLSFLPGLKDPVLVCLWARLNTTSVPARLHLSLVEEGSDQSATSVLIVEDDEQIADLLCLILRRAGLNPTVAKTGRAALETAQQNPPDVVLLDYDLPDMDGFAVLTRRQSNSDTAAIQVVFCSGHYEIEGRALELGARDFLKKPLDLPDIVARLRKVLEHKT